MPYLEIKLGSDTALLQFVGRVDYVFGRLPGCDVQLRDMKVSRLHAQIFMDSRGAAFVRDLGSSGGILINSRKMPKGALAPLVGGTHLRVGDSKITFYDAPPPTNAVEPPARSGPKGLIRMNDRERSFAGDITVVATERVTGETQDGPAEPPPDINPSDFMHAPKGQPQKAAPQPRKKKRDSGIVEAPWDSQRAPAAATDRRVAMTPRPQPSPPPQPQAPSPQPAPPPPEPEPAASEPVAPQSASQEIAPTTSVKPDQDDLALGDNAAAALDEIPDDTGAAAFQPPPVVPDHGPAMPEDIPPSTGMPTVRFDRETIEKRTEEVSDDPAPSLPTAELNETREPPPPPPAPPTESEPESDASEDDDEELTDDDITNYFGGSVSGRYGDVDFEGEPEIPEDEEDEVSFGPAAGDAEDSFDLDDDDQVVPDFEPADDDAEPADNATVFSPRPPEVDDAKGENADDEKDSDAGLALKSEENSSDPEPVAEASEPTNDNPTPPPATEEKKQTKRLMKKRTAPIEKPEPKPSRKQTKRLMKKRSEKTTDKTVEDELSSGAPTTVLPSPDVPSGAKTVFIPKPDNVTPPPKNDSDPDLEKAEEVERHISSGNIDALGEGPGGDTVNLSPELLAKMRAELEGNDDGAPATIGENATVQNNDTEDDDDMDFILDDDYAFFTPPPPTRQSMREKTEPDVIDANDFQSETDNLPESKKSKPKGDPDTITD